MTAVAYNARAAQEMRSRTAGLEANVRTIHSLAYAIVRSGSADLQVVDERTQRSILNPLIPESTSTEPLTRPPPIWKHSPRFVSA